MTSYTHRSSAIAQAWQGLGRVPSWNELEEEDSILAKLSIDNDLEEALICAARGGHLELVKEIAS